MRQQGHASTLCTGVQNRGLRAGASRAHRECPQRARTSASVTCSGSLPTYIRESPPFAERIALRSTTGPGPRHALQPPASSPSRLPGGHRAVGSRCDLEKLAALLAFLSEKAR